MLRRWHLLKGDSPSARCRPTDRRQKVCVSEKRTGYRNNSNAASGGDGVGVFHIAAHFFGNSLRALVRLVRYRYHCREHLGRYCPHCFLHEFHCFPFKYKNPFQLMEGIIKINLLSIS